jgi:hypothetical protein
MRHYNADFVKFHEKISVRTWCAGKISTIFERVEQWKLQKC